jgi:hypothetical protein
MANKSNQAKKVRCRRRQPLSTAEFRAIAVVALYALIGILALNGVDSPALYTFLAPLMLLIFGK